MLIREIKIPIYDVKLKIYVGHDVREILKNEIPDLPIELINNAAIAHCIQTPNGEYCAVFQTNPTINTISHESLHVTVAILTTAGVVFRDESEEAYAYLTGYITQKIYDTVYKK